MTYGNLATAFQAAHVRLQVGNTSGEIITLTNISKKTDFPKTTIQTRTGVAYFYSDAIREVTAEAIVSQDVWSLLTAANTRDAFGNLPQTAFIVYGQSLSGSSTDDIESTFNAQVSTLEDIAGEEGTYLVRMTLIIQNSSYVPQVGSPE